MARAPEVTYVLGAYPELSQTFVLDEILELRRRGVDPAVVARWRGVAGSQAGPAARYAQGQGRVRACLAFAVLLVRRPLRVARVLAAPRRHFATTRREIVRLAPLALVALRTRHLHAHFADLPAALAALLSELTGTPFSFTAHAYDIFERGDLLPRILPAARFAATVSEYNRRFIAQRSPDQAHKLVVVRPGVDLAVFRRRSPYDPDGPVVGVGRLVEKKGFEYLIRALAQAPCGLPPAVIVGDGPERESLQALIDALAAPVTLVGARSHAQVREVLERASAFVLPCVEAASGDRDGEPVVLKEAMALELPVVTSAAFGLPELVGDGRGMLVAPRDAGALGRALCELYALPGARRREMGRRARRFVAEQRNLQIETSKLLELFHLEATA